VIGLATIYALFSGIGWLLLRGNGRAPAERIAFLALTTLGALLWAGVVAERPLDFHRLIGSAMEGWR